MSQGCPRNFLMESAQGPDKGGPGEGMAAEKNARWKAIYKRKEPPRFGLKGGGKGAIRSDNAVSLQILPQGDKDNVH